MKQSLAFKKCCISTRWTEARMMPSGILQPLDVGVNSLPKTFCATNTTSGFRRKITKLPQAAMSGGPPWLLRERWVLSAWAAVRGDVVVRSFVKCRLTLDDYVLWGRSSYDGLQQQSASVRTMPLLAHQAPCGATYRLHCYSVEPFTPGRPTSPLQPPHQYFLFISLLLVRGMTK